MTSQKSASTMFMLAQYSPDGSRTPQDTAKSPNPSIADSEFTFRTSPHRAFRLLAQDRKPPLLMAGGCQGLIGYSRTIASKGSLAHFERMDEKDSPTLFVRLALHAALCGAGWRALKAQSIARHALRCHVDARGRVNVCDGNHPPAWFPILFVTCSVT